MYQFSRAIYRDLAPHIADDGGTNRLDAHAAVLRACEATVERLATDRHYFKRPARTLFNDIRIYFPMREQARVCMAVTRYLQLAEEWLERQPQHGFDVNGNPLQCRATTRKGTACQRVPLPHNGYCPSHQHLAATEDVEEKVAA
jgi:hypothetical protein